MAKRKIVWTNRAKKRFYGIIEKCVTGTKDKSAAKKIVQEIDKELRGLVKYPDLGLKTSKENIRGLIIDGYLLLYETTMEQIIIKTIGIPGKVR